jgi:hypothetical protein
MKKNKFIETTRDNLSSTSVKVVPLTVPSTENYRARKNIAVSLCYQQKTVDRPMSAHAHFDVFSVFLWQLCLISSYSVELGWKLKPVISSTKLQ